MSENQAPRHADPADPVTGTPEEVAAQSDDPGFGTSGDALGTDEDAGPDLTAKADTTKKAATEPSG